MFIHQDNILTFIHKLRVIIFMRNYFFILLFGFFILGCSTPKVVTVKNDDGIKVEEYTVNKDGAKEGEYKRYFADGSLEELAQYKAGKLNGKRTIYHNNGNPEIEEIYINDVIDGEYLVFYSNGSPEIRATYTDGIMQGLLTRYYDSGEVMEEVIMEDNKEHGPFKEYYENGVVQWEGTYMNGENEVGLLKQYNDEGVLIKKMMCDSMSICQTIWTKELGDIKPKKIFN